MVRYTMAGTFDEECRRVLKRWLVVAAVGNDSSTISLVGAHADRDGQHSSAETEDAISHVNVIETWVPLIQY